MVELDVLTNWVSLHWGDEWRDKKKKMNNMVVGVFLFINCVYFKQAVALLVLIAVTSESSYSATGPFWIIYDGNESQGMEATVEERCIVNHAADASLRKEQSGKQRMEKKQS